MVRSVEHGTRWAAKREDKPALRERLAEEVRVYLKRIWQSGLLAGDREDDAFKVDTVARPTDAAGSLTFRVSLAVASGGELVEHTIELKK